MIPQRDDADRARELLADPVLGPAIRDRVAAWPPLPPGVREELARLLAADRIRCAS